MFLNFYEKFRSKFKDELCYKFVYVLLSLFFVVLLSFYTSTCTAFVRKKNFSIFSICKRMHIASHILYVRLQVWHRLLLTDITCAIHDNVHYHIFSTYQAIM